MTALVILVQPTCSGDLRSKGVQFQSTCNLCRESYKTQVWLCFLVLSLLSTSTVAAGPSKFVHLRKCVKIVSDGIKSSDAMLYAPLSYEVETKCKKMSLKCYMLELMMVINEEIVDHEADCVLDYYEELLHLNSVDCPPCEAHSLKNITVFLERLDHLLQEMISSTAM